MNGLFIVKQKTGSFNAAVGDLKLEQTINRGHKTVLAESQFKLDEENTSPNGRLFIIETLAISNKISKFNRF